MRDRRQQIIEGALDAFLDSGYAATSISTIRERSRASTGSIYHFFDGKADIAHALLREAVDGWSFHTNELGRPSSAENWIKCSVGGLLRWGICQPKLFRFMHEVRSRMNFADEFRELERELLDGQIQAANLYAGWVKQALVRPHPWPVAYSLILGPAYLYLTNHGDKKQSHESAIAEIVEAAWEAVKA